MTDIIAGQRNKVTNTTACFDGYVNGFKHWCRANINTCVDVVTVCGGPPGGCAPSIYVNQNKTAIKKTSSDPISKYLAWDFVNESSGVSGTMTFTWKFVGGQDVSDRIFNQTISGKIIFHNPHCPNGCSIGTWGLQTQRCSGHMTLTCSPITLTLHLDYGDWTHRINNHTHRTAVPAEGRRSKRVWFQSNNSRHVQGKLYE